MKLLKEGLYLLYNYLWVIGFEDLKLAYRLRIRLMRQNDLKDLEFLSLWNWFFKDLE
jgi:hypothetical protein